MSDQSLPPREGERYLDADGDGVPDLAPAASDPSKVSPKVIVASVASFVLPAILLGLVFLQTPEGQTYFGGLPKILVIIIGGLLTSAVTGITSYLKKDPARNG